MQSVVASDNPSESETEQKETELQKLHECEVDSSKSDTEEKCNEEEGIVDSVQTLSYFFSEDNPVTCRGL